MNAFFSWIRRVWQTRSAKALVPVIAGSLAVVVLFAAFGATSVAAQGTTPPCSTLIVGTRFTLPAMTVGQEAKVPEVPGATSLCVEAIEGPEELALKLSADFPFTANGNDTPLTVSSSFTTTMALPGGSFNGSLLKAAPVLPVVKVVALTDLSDGVTVWVGSPRASVVAPVLVDQWQDVKVPGSLGELATGITKWAGNGVTVKVTSGMAFTANSTAVLPEVGKLAEYEFYVDTATELKLTGTVPGQRFYLVVDADSVTTDSWLQRRVEAKASPAIAAVSTAGAQYVNLGGACFSAATCSASQAVACVAGAPKLPCTPGDTLSVWRATTASPANHPYLPLLLK